MVSVFVLPADRRWMVRVTSSLRGKSITIRELVLRSRRTAEMYANELRRQWRDK